MPEDSSLDPHEVDPTAPSSFIADNAINSAVVGALGQNMPNVFLLGKNIAMSWIAPDFSDARGNCILAG